MDPIWDLLQDQGVTEIESIKTSFLLLMMLPIVSTIVGFSRHIIGLKTLSIYAPIVIAFAFYEISTEGGTYAVDIDKGLKLGLLLFSTVFFTAALLYYYVIKALKMHYIPKTTLVITGVSVSIAALMIYGTLLDEMGLVYVNFFTLVMLALLSDRFLAIFAKKSFSQAFYTTAQTLVIGLTSFLFMSWSILHDIIYDYPWAVIIGVVLINIYIGTFTGLRWSEYWRFRDIISQER